MNLQPDCGLGGVDQRVFIAGDAARVVRKGAAGIRARGVLSDAREQSEL